jgi:hypothetical protein
LLGSSARSDTQPELRDELDAELKELLTACDRARKITTEHSKIAKDVRNGKLPANPPKIRPVSYDRQNGENFKVGLSIANDGERPMTFPFLTYSLVNSE